jgi:hypothetical protein
MDGIEGGFTRGHWTAFEVMKGIQLERLTHIRSSTTRIHSRVGRDRLLPFTPFSTSSSSSP